MKKITVTLLLLVLAGASQAQLRKCVAPDGKITYSDVLCNSAASTSSIKNADGNSLDSSGARQQTRISRSEKDEAESNERLNMMRQSTPQECKFSYFAVGDEKGKTLAANAKEECLKNIEAKRTGRETSLDDYNLWKDHSSQKSAARQASISRANTEASNRATQSSINGVADAVRNKSYTCKPNIMGSALDCN